MNIYLVRHGTTESNENKKYYGAYESKLTAKGISEAHLLKEKLKDVMFDLVYISTKKRSKETVDIILGKDNQAILDSRLNERDFGIFENRTYEEISEEYNEEFKLWEKDWKKYKIPNGESAIESYKRTEDFFNDIKKLKVENVLLVTHGGFIRNAYCYILGGELENFWRFSSKNGDLTIVKYEYNNWYIDSLMHI